jgi:phospholipid transport system substrate-binding protein
MTFLRLSVESVSNNFFEFLSAHICENLRPDFFMKPKVFLWVSIFLLGLVSQANPVCAETPTSRIRAMLEEVMTVQTRSSPQGQEARKQRRAAIKEIIARNFDFGSMARQALGWHWETLKDSEQAEFKTLFQGLFLDSYTKLVLDFLKQEKILYHPEELRSGRALVKTTIVRVNEEIPVDYSLTGAQGKWLLEDVTIDGVSIVRNYQQAFARTIQRESYKSLLQKLRLQQQAIEKPS